MGKNKGVPSTKVRWKPSYDLEMDSGSYVPVPL